MIALVIFSGFSGEGQVARPAGSTSDDARTLCAASLLRRKFCEVEMQAFLKR